MEVLKVPEFGSRFSFPENQKFELEDNIARMTGKICVQMVEQYEDAVIAEIANAARACGASDVAVLNKKAIMDALMKQVPQKPVDIQMNANGTIRFARCPKCKNDFPDVGGVHEFYCECEQFLYCPDCGQALDWEDDDG